MALYDAQMPYLRHVIVKDFMRIVYTTAMTNQLVHNHYLIDPKRTICQLMHVF